MDIGGWLRRLGLERYEAAFRENEIDDTVLPSLTAEDLKELGVAALGHRRKLLDAIADLRAGSKAAGAAVAAAANAGAAGDAGGGAPTRSRHSSASSFAAMPVESTRSQNITVTCRRSPSRWKIGCIRCASCSPIFCWKKATRHQR
jgi:hypothetical protein